MPTYEYRCKDCSHEFEVAQSFQDAALTQCPSCGGTLRKLFGNVGITFKGSGFYKTDNRSANGSRVSEKADSGRDRSSSESSSDSSGEGTKTEKSTKEPASSSAAPAAKPSTPSTGSSSSD